jgi:predicted alpha/beta-fold hydrolase
MFSRLQLPSSVQVNVAPGGGHLGFIAHRRHSQLLADPDTRWMDWRVIQWVEQILSPV